MGDNDKAPAEHAKTPSKSKVMQEIRLAKSNDKLELLKKHLAEQEETKKRFSEALQRIMNDEDAELNELLCKEIPAIKVFHDFLNMMLTNSTYNNGCFIYGSAGIRKSYHVLYELQNRRIDFVLYNSHSTALGLYEILYKNQNKVIVLDDIEAIMEDKRSIGLLKAASFSSIGERLVTWNSTSKVLQDRELPPSFIFNGKIIIIANDKVDDGRRESIRAFLNRLYTHEIVLSLEDKKLLVRTVFAKQDVFGMPVEEKNSLLDFIEQLLKFSNVDKFNLRTAFKAAEIWKKINREDAKELICALLEVDPELRTFLLIEEKAAHLTVSDRVEIWNNATGYSRRNYFRMKAKYYRSQFKGERVIEKEVEDIESFIRKTEEE